MPQVNSDGDGQAAPKRTAQRRKQAKRRASRVEAPADARASDDDEVRAVATADPQISSCCLIYLQGEKTTSRHSSISLYVIPTVRRSSLQVVEVPPDRAVRLNASGLFEAVQLPGLKLKAPPKPPPPPPTVVTPPAAAAAGTHPFAASAAAGSKLLEAAAAGSSRASPAAPPATADHSGEAETAAQEQEPRAATPKLSRKAKRVLEAELSEHSDTDMSGEDTVQSDMKAWISLAKC